MCTCSWLKVKCRRYPAQEGRPEARDPMYFPIYRRQHPPEPPGQGEGRAAIPPCGFETSFPDSGHMGSAELGLVRGR